MTCIHKSNNLNDCDSCLMHDPVANDGQHYKNSEYGFSVENDGTCVVDEDEHPENSCSMYESVDSEEV